MTDSTTAEQGADHGEAYWVERKGERICADPACPFPGKHVRKDEGAVDRCPLDTRVSVADLADPYSEDAEPTQHMDWGVEATPAEEPIEDRLRRAWLNGFKEGVDRSAFAATEATGRWDY